MEQPDRGGQNGDYLVVRNLKRQFPGGAGVDDVSFTAARGELVTLLGPSGCGKTTTLRCIAGIDPVSDGEILIGGRVVSAPARGISLPPEQRNIGMVFQSYALWPHMSVWTNVAYPLQVRGVPRAEIGPRVAKALGMVGLGHLAQRNPTQLSGGQQQRVSLARALVHEPTLLLLDEPLSNLDARLRESMRVEIRQVQQEIGITALYVTHDQSEAMMLSDRVIVMNAGRLEQVGEPLDVYQNPVNQFVAALMARSNFIDGVLVATHNGLADVEVTLNGSPRTVRTRFRPELREGERVVVCVRPSELYVLPEGEDPDVPQRFCAEVSRVFNMGSYAEVELRDSGLTLVATTSARRRWRVGDTAWVGFHPEDSVSVRPSARALA